jgi:hypothetical protein
MDAAKGSREVCQKSLQAVTSALVNMTDAASIPNVLVLDLDHKVGLKICQQPEMIVCVQRCPRKVFVLISVGIDLSFDVKGRYGQRRKRLAGPETDASEQLKRQQL